MGHKNKELVLHVKGSFSKISKTKQQNVKFPLFYTKGQENHFGIGLDLLFDYLNELCDVA